MPRFLPGSLRDHNDATLLPATSQSFWLNGSALEYPSFDNAESLVKRLARSGMLSRDPMVEDTLLRRQQDCPCVPHNATSCDPRASRMPRFARSNEHDMQRSCSRRVFRSWM